jgi:hypothetical protein
MTIGEDEYLNDHTISLETQPDLMGESIYAYVWNNFHDFITKIRNLSEEDQELLLSYYLLGKTQTSLAIVNKSTQTICSTKIRMAQRGSGLVSGVSNNPMLAPKLVNLKEAVDSVSGQVKNGVKIADGLVSMAKAGNMKIMPTSTSDKPVAVSEL